MPDRPEASDLTSVASPHDPVSVPDETAAAAPPPRRTFLTRVSVALGALAAAAVGVPVIGFLVAPVSPRQDEQWRAVGPATRFRMGETEKVSFLDAAPTPWGGASGESAAWLRRESNDRFTAFAINCTHLGCPVRWEAGAQLFMCPCHGGVFYADGSVAAGPPPRALTRYPVRVEDGQVYIRTTPLPIT